MTNKEITDIIRLSEKDSLVGKLAEELLHEKIQNEKSQKIIDDLRRETDILFEEVEKAITDIESTKNKFFLFRLAAWIRAVESFIKYLGNVIERHKKKAITIYESVRVV